MKIAGLQKLTLLDFPGRVACTVFLDGCNFRCPYCHNSELLKAETEPVMTTEELMAFLRKRRGILEGVCITGGEPTLHPALPELLRAVKALDYPIKLDTNGSRPEMLRRLLAEGLVDYLAMDLKNGPEQYAQTVGLCSIDLDKIGQSIRLLQESGLEFELRTTVVKPLHSVESITFMAKWLLDITAGRGVHRLFVQPFVDRDTVPVSGLSAPNRAELEQFIEILRPAADIISLRGT